MELVSHNFKEAVNKGVNSTKPVIGTINNRVMDPVIDTIKANSESVILEVTSTNRDTLHLVLVENVLQYLEKQIEIAERD